MWKPTTEHGGSSIFSSSMKAIRSGRSILSMRRNQVLSMETELEELDLFQIHVTEGLFSLLNLSSEEYSLLTMKFLVSLLGFYLRIDEEFRNLLPLVQSQNSGAGAVSVLAKPPLDRVITDHLDRSIKSLDICTAVTNSLDMLSYSNRDAEIAASAICGKSPNRPQFNRAKNAIGKLLSSISPARISSPKRTWSFGRSSSQDDLSGESLKYPHRTLSLSLSKNWSAAKQLAAMEANLPIFFVGVAAVGIGSSYYHLSPNDSTLVWDRLPMTVAFTSIVAIFIIERVDEKTGTASIIPLFIVGVVSILYWRFFDDLRPYAVVQFVPCIVVPLMAILMPPMYTHSTYWLWAAAFYLLAKIEEAEDKLIYRLTYHVVSGHTLKHLCAAMVPVFLTLMLAKRSIIPERKSLLEMWQVSWTQLRSKQCNTEFIECEYSSVNSST